ncbi:hypothetical protein [Halarcobacter sp.]|uniref:hypothetical protein n=1 Tax=Halarcobacter sp. TaxID=2321133 RepID=UPI003A942227
MPYVKMNVDGKRGSKAYKKGQILEVSASLADLYILNAKGSKSTKEEFEKQKKHSSKIEKIFNLTDEEILTFEYENLRRKELEAFAVRVGIDVVVAEESENVSVLKALIDTKIKGE